MSQVQLSSALGEVLVPGMLVVPLLLAPDGTITIEPGALHGRSGIESKFQRVASASALKDVQRYWFIWVAVELDMQNIPARYKGIAVSELFVDPVGMQSFKALAEQVNRIGDAIGGRANLRTLEPAARQRVREKLIELSTAAWDAATPAVMEALL